ncbi:uncharacterized protein [Scyliorhinus torazame]|uniref:uncharacterized protein isoform X3 n=1 Tax=Scyliorhinus torazame TaxID=75743 RepID=UPI003B59097F
MRDPASMLLNDAARPAEFSQHFVFMFQICSIHSVLLLEQDSVDQAEGPTFGGKAGSPSDEGGPSGFVPRHPPAKRAPKRRAARKPPARCYTSHSHLPPAQRHTPRRATSVDNFPEHNLGSTTQLLMHIRRRQEHPDREASPAPAQKGKTRRKVKTCKKVGQVTTKRNIIPKVISQGAGHGKGTGRKFQTKKKVLN